MRLLRRNAEGPVREALGDTRVVVINGPRQAGKSTLARLIAQGTPGSRYVTLDDETTLASARDDPKTFIRHSGLLVIDEVQREPRLMLAIKQEVDRDPRPGRFLLTGSAHVLALPALADSLAGRMQIVELWPFTQGEILGKRERFLDHLLHDASALRVTGDLGKEEYLEMALRGGFPEARSRIDPHARARWFESYLESLIQRDIRELVAIERAADLRALLRVVGARTACLTNHEALAREVSAPQTTIRRYLALLQATFLVEVAPAWSANALTRVTRSPKLYVSDTGLASFLTGRPISAPMSSTQDGPLMETFVMMELRRQSAWSRARPSLHHFHTREGKEVDIIVEGPDGRIAAVEVKFSATPTGRDFAGLRYLRAKTRDRSFAGIVLYPGREPLPFGDDLWAIPISALWEG